jgi:carboxypeptidase PM20D1
LSAAVPPLVAAAPSNCYQSVSDRFGAVKKLSLTIFGILATLAVVILVRAVTFPSRQLQVRPAHAIAIDRDGAMKRLSEAIRFKTISFQEPSDASAQEFTRLHAFLAKSFPRVHRQLTKETVNGHSLLYTWNGQGAQLKPMLLMGHMDVVPVDARTERQWTHPPFAGEIADGYIWGRGAMDDKVGVLGILEAVEYLLSTGFQPQRTVHLAFGHDEEIGGANGAGKIAELLRTRGVELEYVLDEGMNVVDGIIPGIPAPAALIGIAEKGYLSLDLSVETAGGHSSIPPIDTAIGIISRALQRLEAAPFPARLSGPTRRMLEFLGPEMAWPQRLALANLWIFDPLVKKQLTASPLTNAAIRTTLAPTLFNAGVKENVLPTQARAAVNLRIVPGDTIAGVTEHVRKTVDDPRVKIAALPIRVEPSAISDIEVASFQLIHRTIRQALPEALVAPALLVAATDSRHYAALTKNIYRFLPITLRPDDARRYHGNNERISLQDYERCVRFYLQLIRNSQP